MIDQQWHEVVLRANFEMKSNLLVFHTDAVVYIFDQHVYNFIYYILYNSKHESMFSFTHVYVKY